MLMRLRDARRAKRPRGGPRRGNAQELVKGKASVHSGRQTEYNIKAARRNNAHMGDRGERLDGGRCMCAVIGVGQLLMGCDVSHHERR
jgi:hypothetical protein